MSEFWQNVDNVLYDSEGVPDSLLSYKRLMEETPEQAKIRRTDNAHQIYSKNEFIILKIYTEKNTSGYIIYNTNKTWQTGHTHIKNYNVAKTIIDNVINKKKPKTKNIYLLTSHGRISNDDKYISFIESLIDKRKNKRRNKYVNRSRV